MQPDSGMCEARIGLRLGGAVPVGESLAGARGCPEPATVTLRAACACGHVRVKRYCAAHSVTVPADGVWLCLPCAEAGHDCPLTPEVVADADTL